MNHNELELIKKAILNEIEGYEFYKLTASQATSPETRDALLSIANEELTHIDWLKALFNSQKNAGDEFDLAMVADPPSPKLYSWDHLMCKNVGLAVSVFGIAMEMENVAMKFYEDARNQSDDPKVKKLFDTLIGWEKNHYDLFAKEYAIVQQDWWSEQGFAPF